MKAARAVVTFSFGYILTVVCASGGNSASWVHKITDAANPRVGSLRIQTVAEEDGRLVGRATYRETAHDVTVQIEGIQTPDGRFWPDGAVEVAGDLNGTWKILDEPKMPGRRVSFPFRFAEANPMLYFSVESLRPLIGKMRYGRLTLTGGEMTLFELKDLLPREELSRNNTEDDWDLRTLFGYLADPLAKGAFVVGGISFEEGHLHAVASYLDPLSTSATIIEGTKTSKRYSDEEEFWASATLQVTNDPDGEWQTVGQSATPGVPASIMIQPKEKSVVTLSIGVDVLRPLAAKFGYGRAVLKDGKAAAFETKDLLPPSRER